MSINRIAFYHLETLLCIERLGSFGAAAAHLNTSQPAISARIAELEERLGTKLFQKSGRAMVLTPTARELVREYLPLWEKLQETLLRSSSTDGLSGVVRIGTGEIAAATCIPGFIAKLKKQWQDLSFDIEIQLTAQLIENLLGGKIDLAFAAGAVAHPALVSTTIGGAELVWIACPELADKIMDDPSTQASLWSLQSHSPLHHVVTTAAAEIGIQQKSISLCNNVRTIIDIVTSGDGFALVPKTMVQAQLADRSLQPVFPEHRPAPIMFQVVARANETDPVIRRVIERASELQMGAFEGG